MGRLCIVCTTVRPNEVFGGKGRRARICRKCRQLPHEQQEALLNQNEIQGFLEQSHISKKNIARLHSLAQSENARIVKLAIVVLEVALFAPYRRRRIRNLAREHRDVLTRMEEVGLILPRPVLEDTDPYDDNPFATWDEWVDFANKLPCCSRYCASSKCAASL